MSLYWQRGQWNDALVLKKQLEEYGSIGRAKPPLQWRHNEGDGVSNHRRLDDFLNRLLRRRSKKTSKLRVTGLCEGNSPVTGEFTSQRLVTRKMIPFNDVIMAKNWWYKRNKAKGNNLWLYFRRSRVSTKTSDSSQKSHNPSVESYLIPSTKRQ